MLRMSMKLAIFINVIINCNLLRHQARGHWCMSEVKRDAVERLKGRVGEVTRCLGGVLLKN